MIQERSEGTLIDVRVTPRSSRTHIEGVVDGVLKVRIAAPPVGGAANDALVKLLASYFKIPKSQVDIISGTRGRTKQVLLRGLGAADITSRLEMT